MHSSAHNRRLNEKWLKLGLEQALGEGEVNMLTASLYCVLLRQPVVREGDGPVARTRPSWPSGCTVFCFTAQLPYGPRLPSRCAVAHKGQTSGI